MRLSQGMQEGLMHEGLDEELIFGERGIFGMGQQELLDRRPAEEAKIDIIGVDQYRGQ
jgi:hypothetical protein